LRVPPLSELQTIQSDTTLDVPGSPQVIAMPGHTRGGVGCHVPAMSAVFVGDAMTTRSVLTGEIGPAASAVHARAGAGQRIVRTCGGYRRALGAARAWSSVGRWDRPGGESISIYCGQEKLRPCGALRRLTENMAAELGVRGVDRLTREAVVDLSLALR
jgi:glyoxylase-like metal-dependent hydrolase (beta-lactamase superfamily II)